MRREPDQLHERRMRRAPLAQQLRHKAFDLRGAMPVDAAKIDLPDDGRNPGNRTSAKAGCALSSSLTL